MKQVHVLNVFPVLAMLFAPPVFAADLTQAFDARHKACLEQIGQDADLAYEEALIWRGDGGGRRARHCEAMALFALGHKEEAANRLDALSKAPDGGSPEMRANFAAEAANFWLISDEPERAYASASHGLETDQKHTASRIARARAYALLEHYDYAETDLTSALIFEPDNAEALRYRADARHRQDKLSAALEDIERALAIDPTSVETAVVRGQIREAIRIKNKTPRPANTTE